MEDITSRRWTIASIVVAAVVVLIMVIASLTPGIVALSGGSDLASSQSPARDIATAQHTDVNLGDKVTQIYLISVIGILLIAVISFIILVIMALRERRKENI